MSHEMSLGAIFFGTLLLLAFCKIISDRLPFGWRWHFRMSRVGQWLLKAAHASKTPQLLHDLIERLVYGRKS